MKKLTVTIGIPAYNEEQNIGHLLVNIFNQSTSIAILDEIIIVSDGSTDNTIKAIKKITDVI